MSTPIACNIAGLRELVTHGSTGLLVPAGDTHALATAITSLLQDSSLRNRMGQVGRERIRAEFTSDKMALSYADLYAKAGRQSRTSAG